MNFKTSFTSCFVMSLFCRGTLRDFWRLKVCLISFSLKLTLFTRNGVCSEKVLSQSFVWQFRLICYHCGYFMCYMFLSVWFLLVNIVTAFAFLWILDDFNPFLLVVMLFQISFFLYFLFPVFRISVKYVFVKSPIIITYHLLSSFLLPHIKGMITISFTGLL